MPLPLTVRHNREPDEADKLSQDDLDALILEVLKTYQEPEVTKDPYMSPLLAPDDMLTGLPTTHIIVSGGYVTWYMYMYMHACYM